MAKHTLSLESWLTTALNQSPTLSLPNLTRERWRIWTGPTAGLVMSRISLTQVTTPLRSLMTTIPSSKPSPLRQLRGSSNHSLSSPSTSISPRSILRRRPVSMPTLLALRPKFLAISLSRSPLMARASNQIMRLSSLVLEKQSARMSSSPSRFSALASAPCTSAEIFSSRSKTHQSFLSPINSTNSPTSRHAPLLEFSSQHKLNLA
mmetsp:Transcript_15083/g.31080  ORF Transcript_15083/g.31080 Transcript_15083/m.31080 type:complete len:206 (+) Transcript_15083:938-1555(+)